MDFLSTFPLSFIILACIDGSGYDSATRRYWALLLLLSMARPLTPTTCVAHPNDIQCDVGKRNTCARHVSMHHSGV